MTDRDAMVESGHELARRFCELNRLPMPELRLYTRAEWRFDACGYYRPEAIHLCPSRCSPIGRANRAWSYPGYVTDRTPHGVVAHELGHHVDHRLSVVKGAYGGDYSEGLRARTREPRLTSYCPNDWEWFAEMFRLFVTNSDLLRAVRPRTHAELAELFSPAEVRPWREVLAGAPERTVAMASRKAGEAI